MSEPFYALAPYLTINDGVKAMAFYEKAFDAKQVSKEVMEDGRLMHGSMAINGGLLMLSDAIMPESGDADGDNSGTKAPVELGSSSVTIHIDFTDNTKTLEAWDQAVSAGCEVIMPLKEQFWGSIFGKLRDPYGHIWSIAGPNPNH